MGRNRNRGRNQGAAAPEETKGADVYEQISAQLKSDAEEAARPAEEQAEDFRRVRYWQKGKPLPKHHIRQRLQPCPKCLRVLLDSLGQACICVSATKDVAFYRCRACEHRWQMPVKIV